MIRFHGLETVHGYAREAVFAALLVKENWPSVAGVRIGPEAELLADGGRVRAALELPGVVLKLAGSVTKFEPPHRLEASGTQAGIWAATTVSMTDDANRREMGEEIETTVAWRFEARLPLLLAMLELPATGAIRIAIPTIRARFLANIRRYLDERAAEPGHIAAAAETKK